MLARLDIGLEETERKLAATDTSRWLSLVDQIVDECHPDQRAFVLDPARYLAALVGRGGGKTIGGAVRFVKRLLTTPNANCFYLAKFREHAERLMWKPIKAMFEGLGFEAGKDVVYNETKLRITLPKTGATLHLFGADKPGWIESLRGQSYDEVGVDEGSSHPDELLTNLIKSIIGPRLIGALWVIGSPGKRLKGLFYDVTRRGATLSRPYRDRHSYPDWRGWSLHKWTLKGAVEATADRPIKKLVELWKIQQDEIATQQLSDNNPVKRREYDGEWASDETTRVYQYQIHNEAGQLWNQWDPERIGPLRIAKLPTAFSDWAHVVSMDPGSSDPTAINVFATSPSDPARTIYHRLCFEAKGLYAQLIAHQLIGAELKHATPGGIIGAIGEWPNGMVADMAHQMAQMLIDELSNVYGIHIEPAKKGLNYKIGAIDLVNGDFFDGRIKVLKDSALEEQLLDLEWDESKSGERIERPGAPNHSTDCLVYGRVKLTTFMTASGSAAAPSGRIDPRAPGYVPPLPTAPRADDYSQMFQDDYAALLG